jgi:hypothetical protein
MSEDRVTEALRALRRADSELEIDGEAEVRTLLKFRRQRRRRRLRGVAWGSAIAAVLVVSMLYRPAPEARHVIVAASVAAVEVSRPPTAVVAPPAKRRSVPKREPEEVVTPFFPLMVSAPPFESGLLVRMTVPASAMRNVGFDVSEEHLSDPVLADVLVGQDDLARAIRFVSYE